MVRMDVMNLVQLMRDSMNKKRLFLGLAIASNVIMAMLLILSLFGYIKWGNIYIYILIEIPLLVWLVLHVASYFGSRRTKKDKENLPYGFDDYKELERYIDWKQV